MEPEDKGRHQNVLPAAARETLTALGIAADCYTSATENGPIGAMKWNR
jgi:hypothetical protein